MLTHLQILRCAVPNIYALPKRIIAIVESATVLVEFVGELSKVSNNDGRSCTRMYAPLRPASGPHDPCVS